jgi:hypothetical protein
VNNIHKMNSKYLLTENTVRCVQAQVTELIANGTDLYADHVTVQDKFITVLEALDDLGQMLSREMVTTGSIMYQTYKIAALAAMFGESLELNESA